MTDLCNKCGKVINEPQGNSSGGRLLCKTCRDQENRPELLLSSHEPASRLHRSLWYMFWFFIVFSVSFELAFNSEWFLIHFAITLVGFVVMGNLLYRHVRWTWSLHTDLAVLFPGYPISPGRALFDTLMPYWNIYGIPHVVHRFASASATLGGNTVHLAVRVRLLTTLIMISIVFSTIFTFVEAFSIGAGEVPPPLWYPERLVPGFVVLIAIILWAYNIQTSDKLIEGCRVTKQTQV